jgi:hypothetical protein
VNISTTRSISLLSILILTGGVPFLNLYAIDNALAVESRCTSELQHRLFCVSASESQRSSTASSRGIQEEDKDVDIGIEGIDSTSGTNHIEARDNDHKGKNGEANIESQLPSTINAIPFP